jgi:hypothetical protein
MINTELYINNTLIDISEDMPIPLNFQVSDVREPESKKGNFSKTAILPGTARNNRVLTNIFEIGKVIQNTSGQFNPDFNPNINASGVILQGGMPVFTGTAQLLRINNDRERLEYEFNLFGTSINLFTRLADDLVSDLDISELDHELTIANTSGSWNDFIWIDSVSTPFAIGVGYVYPLIDFGESVSFSSYNVTELVPALYYRYLIDKIVTGAGFTWTSAFLDSTFFKSLVIPSSPEQMSLSADEITAKLYQGENIVAQTEDYLGGTFKILFPNDSTGGNFDNGGNFAGSVYTAPDNGWYSFHAKPQMNIVFSGGQVFTSTQAFWCWVEVWNGGTIVMSKQVSVSIPAGSYLLGDETTVQDIYLAVPNLFLAAGDTVSVQLTIPLFYKSGALFSTQEWQVKTGSIFYNSIDNNRYGEGSDIDMNKALPPKIKQSELLSNLFRQFNLWVMQNPDDDNDLIIEPYDDFYLDTVTDWSEKIDYNSPIRISPMSELQSNKYRFTYTEDKDYRNQLYLASNNELYGQRIINVDNDFLTEEKVIDILFAPTPLVGENAKTLIIPQIVGTDPAGVVVMKNIIPRVLFYGGLKDGVWGLDGAVGPAPALTEYPYAGHLDDAFDPTIDLSFAPPKQLYYKGDITYTDNNIYNKYWKRYIEEITSKDSKLVSAWVNLNEVDIAKLNIRNLFFWDGQYFRLQAIKDYNPVDKEKTLCEFLKVEQVDVFVATTKDIKNGGGDPIGDDDTLPTFSPNVDRGRNVQVVETKGSDQVIGEGNVIGDVDGYFVQGDNNTIGDGASCVHIACGNNNIVAGGLSNIILIGVSNQTIYESNTVLIGDAWDDLTVSIDSIRLMGANPPTATAYKGGYILAFPKTVDKTVYFNFQMPHGYKEGSDIEFHVHYVLPTAGAGGGAENIKWDFTYSWSNFVVGDESGVVPDETAVSETIDVQDLDADTQYLGEVAEDIDGTDMKISSCLICSLTRDTGVADDYDDDVYLVSLDLHYQKNSLGSVNEDTK